MKRIRKLMLENDNGSSLIVEKRPKRYFLTTIDMGKTDETTYTASVPYYNGVIYTANPLMTPVIIVKAVML